MSETKRCTNCTRGPQALTEFQGKFGPAKQCKSCREKCKKRDENKRKDLDYVEHKNEVQRERKYYQDYRDRKKDGNEIKRDHDYDQQCSWRNTEKCKSRLAHWKKTNFTERLGQYKRSAITRGYHWNMTDDRVEALFSSPCHYCGLLDLEHTLNGIDRVDNTKGYDETNVVSCCKLCNNFKHTLSVNEFITHANRIVKPEIDKNKEFNCYDRLRSTKSNADKRGYDWYLSDEYSNELFQSPCHYCGKCKRSPNGIDRVDNTLGYYPSNVVPCCKLCNYFKKDYTLEQFLEHAKKIAEYQCAQ